MPNVTVSVSEELKRKMDEHEDVNWSAVSRWAIEGKLRDLDELYQLRTIQSKIKLTESEKEEFVQEMIRKIREGRKRGVTLTSEERRAWRESHR